MSDRVHRLGLVGGLVVTLSLSACTGSDSPGALANATASPTPSRRIVGPPVPSSPASAVSPAAELPGGRPGRVVSIPTTVAGALAETNPPVETRPAFSNISYQGVELGVAEGRVVVAYPQVFVAMGPGGPSVHVKLPFVTCDERSPTRPSDFLGCRDRRVEYTDVVGTPSSVSEAASGALSVDVEAVTYEYGRGTDRDKKVQPRWTGRAYRVRATMRPGVVLNALPGFVLHRAVGTVTVEQSAEARQDDGYMNLLRLART